MYQSPKVAKPAPGTMCVVFDNRAHVHLAMFHQSMGDASSSPGGDFATVAYTARGMKLDHLPGVLLWEEIRPPSDEECDAARAADEKAKAVARVAP